MARKPPEPLFCLKSDMGYIHNLTFSKQDTNPEKALLVATEQGFVYTWDLNTNRVRHKQQLGESIQAIHLFENRLLTQEKNGLVKLWQKTERDFRFLFKYDFFGGYCRSLLIDKKLFLPQDNSKIDIINVETMTIEKQLLPTSEKLGNLMAIQKIDDHHILGGYETGDIVLWDFSNDRIVSQSKLRECITSLDYDPIRKRGVSGNTSEFIQIFTIANTITLNCEISIINEGCNCVKLRDDYKILAVGGWDGKIRLFSWKTLKLLVVLDEHRGSITDLKFSEGVLALWGCPVLAASGADGCVSLWNLYN